MAVVASTITNSDSESDTFSKEWSEHQDLDKYTRKRHLMNRIFSLVGKDDGRRQPLNIAIVGPMGVGKSSFINTMAAALSDDFWHEYAYCGFHGGSGAHITVFNSSYRKCCLESKYKSELLPTIIDIAGFEDEDHEKWVELLRIIFYGRLPEGESSIEAERYYRQYGIDGLRRKYCRNNEKLKVDRVVFVSAASSPVPTHLIKCVVEAARPSGSKQVSQKRSIPIFGVMTKGDKIGETKDITQSEYDIREQDFFKALGIIGASHRFVLCSNYCDDVDMEGKRKESVIPELDIPVLLFMTQLFHPATTVVNAEETYLGSRSYKDRFAALIQYLRRNNRWAFFLSIFLKTILIALVLHMWFEIKKVKQACSKSGVFHNPEAADDFKELRSSCIIVFFTLILVIFIDTVFTKLMQS